MKTILVTGGAGYIGSVAVRALQKSGYQVVVFDSLEFGHRESVTCPLVVGNLLDTQSFHGLEKYTFDAVIHFAAYLQVGESMQDPFRYFQNNVLGGLNLLEYMRKKKIQHIVFSSTAAIFGYPEKIPITEEEKKLPVNVYGESKLLFETVLSWYDRVFAIKSISLRYFNAAGATRDATLGELHNPETHIIPVAIKNVLEKKPLILFGKDYPTPDGTCIRDYIHVEDLASAHILALEYLKENKTSEAFNLGTGKGYSNKEVAEMVKRISGKDLEIRIGPKRSGDPAVLLADNTKAKKLLHWSPEYSDLETIVSSAWKFYTKSS